MNKTNFFRTTLVALLLVSLSQGQLRGVNYGIQRSDGSCSSYEQVLADLQVIKGFAQAVKIFQAGYCNGASNVIQAAQATGLKVFLGVQASPEAAFNGEKTALTNAFNAHGFADVLGITVGSEDLYREDVTSDYLASKITEVKNLVSSLGSSVPVTHTDVYYLQPQNIIDASDIVMFNAFPYWEGKTIGDSGATMIDHYNSVKAKAGGKTVWIGETGWPTAGANTGAAVPNSDNMRKYLNDFVCWANANGVPYFWFEAFDEPWKGAGVESHWGLYTQDRVKKDAFLLSCGTPSTDAPTLAPTSAPTSAQTAAPTSADASSSPAVTSSPATPTPSSSPVSDTNAPVVSSADTPNSSQVVDQTSNDNGQGIQTQSGVGRQQNGGVSLIFSSSLLILIALLLV